MKEISIREFEVLSIGQAENKAAATGCTVLLLGKNGVCVGQDVRGGEPAYGLPAVRDIKATPHNSRLMA